MKTVFFFVVVFKALPKSGGFAQCNGGMFFFRAINSLVVRNHNERISRARVRHHCKRTRRTPFVVRLQNGCTQAIKIPKVSPN